MKLGYTRPVLADAETSKEAGKFLKSLGRSKDSYYKFDRPEESPYLGLGVDVLANFYGAVINIDHHFWTLSDGKVTLDYGSFRGEKLKGANYLWRRSVDALNKFPDFFSAKNLSQLSENQYAEWLGDDEGKIPVFDKDMHRLSLTRDFGSKLSAFYDGKLSEMYEQSGHKLIAEDGLSGFLQRCESFDGMSDWPFYKKANLVAKIMERRGLWKFEDPQNKVPPMDYHLQNVAIKSGMVKIESQEFLEKIKRGEFPSKLEEFDLRLACQDAYRIVSEASGIDPYYLDDDFWNEGRKYLQPEVPNLADALLSNFYLKQPEEIRNLPYVYVDTWRY